MSMTEAIDSLDRVMETLDAALAVRDLPTHDHSSRVVPLARRLGEACGLEPMELAVLNSCARFHDIGKIGIPDGILRKPGKLTKGEYLVIMRHAAIGGELIRRIRIPGINTFATIVEHHHERIDGKGYPHGLAGEDIPLFSRIISIADSYDAITSRRDYHEASRTEIALDTISRDRGTHYDPELTDLFLCFAEELEELKGEADGDTERASAVEEMQTP